MPDGVPRTHLRQTDSARTYENTNTMNQNLAAEPTPPDHQLPSQTGNDAKPRKKSRLIVWLLMFLVFGALLWWVMHRKPEANAAAPPGGRRGAVGGPVV